jgi:hypothetical protein
MDYETLRSIQLLALKSVEKPTYEDFYRKVCRWYSTKFSTPLTEVEDMAEEHVLRHYFEDNYSALYESDESESKQAYERVRESIISDMYEQEEAAKEDDDWVEQMKREVQGEAKTFDDQQKQAMENPNLLKEESVQGETEIPLFNDDQE